MQDNNFALLNGVDPQPEPSKKTKKKRRNRAGNDAAPATASHSDQIEDAHMNDPMPTTSLSEAVAADDGFETVCHHCTWRDSAKDEV